MCVFCWGRILRIVSVLRVVSGVMLISVFVFIMDAGKIVCFFCIEFFFGFIFEYVFLYTFFMIFFRLYSLKVMLSMYFMFYVVLGIGIERRMLLVFVFKGFIVRWERRDGK